ncbi:hypothetical protein [Sphingobacterium multivorum]|uniref:hypothetical protein n=2 Tax=Sphingobacterium TaxID=28453 RepID=UPI0028A88AB7|nr:hypothetical protein [Sphingobacterium multivorum]
MNEQKDIKITRFGQLFSIPTTANRINEKEIRFEFDSPNLNIFDLYSITAKKDGEVVNIYSPSVPNPLSKGEVFEQLQPWAQELFQIDK